MLRKMFCPVHDVSHFGAAHVARHPHLSLHRSCTCAGGVVHFFDNDKKRKRGTANYPISIESSDEEGAAAASFASIADPQDKATEASTGVKHSDFDDSSDDDELCINLQGKPSLTSSTRDPVVAKDSDDEYGIVTGDRRVYLNPLSGFQRISDASYSLRDTYSTGRKQLNKQDKTKKLSGEIRAQFSRKWIIDVKRPAPHAVGGPGNDYCIGLIKDKTGTNLNSSGPIRFDSPEVRDKMKLYQVYLDDVQNISMKTVRTGETYDIVKSLYPQPYKIALFDDAVTDEKLYKLMLAYAKGAAIVIAPASKSEVMKQIWHDIMLGKTLNVKSMTTELVKDDQMLSDGTSKWKHDHTLLPTSGDRYCGWHSIFVGLKQNGIESYGIEHDLVCEKWTRQEKRKYRLRSSKVKIIREIERSGGKISLTDACKQKIRNKVQAQSEHLTGERRESGAGDEFLDVHRDIPTIIYYLRKEQNIDLSVELYSEPGLYGYMTSEEVRNIRQRLGGITIFENSKISLTGREQKVKLYVHYNNDQRSNATAAHFDLRASSTSSASGAASVGPRTVEQAAAVEREKRAAVAERRRAEKRRKTTSSTARLQLEFADILL